MAHLDIVRDEHLPQVKHLQHGGGRVVRDAVSLQHVLGDEHLPGQPALVEGGVEGEEVGQVARLTAAETFVLFDALRDGFYLALLAVGACAEGKEQV